MKLLIISGTPRIEGLTFEFVQMAESTAKSIGLDVEVINLSDEKLEKCVMCGDGWGVCFHDHYCILKDNFPALQEKMKEAAAYVFITPVYWGEMSEDMKTFIDRLRRCEASKSWDKREDVSSCLIGKPSIIVANAGGGGGGIINTFNDVKRALVHMGADAQPKETVGIFDMIAVNRWNKDYKLDALKAAVTEMHKYMTGELLPWRTFKDKTKERE
ncbi:MAG: flavodoxin family protein [Defluviitaleaceae bacterium]|nr:flavodoxin family protein [Defluviitaleaceae bacterium]